MKNTNISFHQIWDCQKDEIKDNLTAGENGNLTILTER